jgi:hypothetical protein
MVRTTFAAVVITLSLAGAFLNGGRAFADPAAASAAPGPDGDCHRVESERFVFHSDPWINLHHLLFQWARDVSPRQPGDRRREVEVPEQAQLGDLDDGERQVWQQAVDSYGERLVAADLLFDRRLIGLRGQLAAISCSAAGTDDIDAEVRTVLTEAMPVYRRHWWPDHHRTNTAWIQNRLKELELYERTMGTRLAAAYGGEWPRERIRVDVSAYANWAGAYTTNHPDHVTVCCVYEGLQGLEILFHEVSHASFFEQPLLGQLAAAFRRLEADPPDRLFHAIQFVTPAEILRSLLSPEERARVKLVADGMAQRRRSRRQYEIVLEHWRPFLEGQVERAEALDRIAAEVVGPKKVR